MSVHPFDRILSLAASDASDETLARAVSLKIDRRRALSALVAASSAALAGDAARGDEPRPSTRALGEEGAGGAPSGDAAGELPTFRGRGIYLVSSRMGEIWQNAAREKLNILGPYVPSSQANARTDRAEELLPEESAAPSDPTIPPPIPTPPGEASGAANVIPERPPGFLAWLTASEAADLAERPVVSGVTPYLPDIKVVAPAEIDARMAAVLLLGPNHWTKKPPAETFASPSEVADDLKRSLAEVAADISVGQTADALVVRHAGGEPVGDEVVRRLLAHPQVAAIQWETVATTLALGEEGGEKPGGEKPGDGRPTTLALGEEAGPGDPSTLALGEEGGSVTTQALGEEGGQATTFALGEEGGPTTYAIGEEGANATTFALGEEGGTTYALGEEGGTTYALGEEGGGVTTKALGEEGGVSTRALGEEGGTPPSPTTFKLGEEGGPIPEKPPASTRALGEEGGRPPSPSPNPTTLAVDEEGGGRPRPIPPTPRPDPPRTTMALGEEGGGKRGG